MNWKEEFDKSFYNSEDPDEGEQLGLLGLMMNGEDCNKQLKDFISTEIIEKLIDEIPDELAGQYGTINPFPKLKQQLKDKYLK